jgi:predicted alpha/beta superfamily hydrolase
MKNVLIISIFIFLNTFQVKAQIPTVVNGKIVRIENFKSKFVTARNVDIWLPEGYCDTAKYAVLYMHDGKMLFDPALCWNKQAWDVDETGSKLMTENKTKKFIVVGIWNGGETRHPDYFPQKPFEQLTQIEKDTVSAQLKSSGRIKDVFQPNSDNYLKFIVNELKPFIDKNYAVYKDRANTFIAGSSMGGLISMYAICEYPKIFGGAACLSTHWIGSFTLHNNPMPNAFVKYLRKNLPSPKNHKIYFDCGDQSLDALYPEIQQKVDKVMISNRFSVENWKTKYLPGEDHSEKAWSKRLNIPLEFLLGK